MSKINWKGGALTAPLPPVLVTCSDGRTDNVFTVAWTGITCTQPPKTYISVRPSRFSYNIIKGSGVFAVNLTTEALISAADTCGVRSGRDVDKFSLLSLEKTPAFKIPCPLLQASPLSLECRVDRILPLGSHDMFLADIVAVDVESSLLGSDGRLRLERAGLAAFAHGQYFALGRKLGSFGYSVRKKRHGPVRRSPGTDEKNKK